MSQEVGLFGANSPAVMNDRLKELMAHDEKLAGGGFGTTRRISLRGSKFREMVNGEQMKVSKDDHMNMIIIDSAPVARTFYEGTYDPDNIAAPVCWSANTDAPDADTTSPQATRCADCPQNIKGSGQGNTRACRYSQRLAVCIEGDLETVYQLQLAATSIFGDAKENEMPMQGYARFLKANNMPSIGLVTEMRFDEDADVPKLYFKGVRPLTEEELDTAIALRGTEAVNHAIEFKVFETDKVAKAIPVEVQEPEVEEKPAPKAKAKPKAKAAQPEDEEEEIPEPTKVESKASAVSPDDKEDLAGMIAGWDD
tara:strand:+ start:1763 stop:2695 length:933 start_codon:yes stop_codon:yes gene_type:complete